MRLGLAAYGCQNTLLVADAACREDRMGMQDYMPPAIGAADRRPRLSMANGAPG